MNNYLQQEIKFLPGVGPKRAAILQSELDIYTFSDLLYYYPFKHVDRSRFYTVRELEESSPWVQLRGRIISVQKIGEPHRERLSVTFADQTGTIQLVFFKGVNYLLKKYAPGTDYILFGKPSVFNGNLHFVHPELEETAKSVSEIQSPLQAMYNTTEKMKNNFLTSKVLSKMQSALWKNMPGKLPETMPESLITELRLMTKHEAVFNMHFPQSAENLKRAEYRIKLEECLFLQLDILRRKQHRVESIPGHIFGKVGDIFYDFFNRGLDQRLF